MSESVSPTVATRIELRLYAFVSYLLSMMSAWMSYSVPGDGAKNTLTAIEFFWFASMVGGFILTFIFVVFWFVRTDDEGGFKSPHEDERDTRIG